MKKRTVIPLLLMALLILGACSSQFDGSRTGNESQLITEYKVLNGTDSQVLELAEGDILDFEVTSKSGQVSIRLEKEDGEMVYSGTDIPTSSFAVEVAESGSYTLSVIGKNARGGVRAVKR